MRVVRVEHPALERPMVWQLPEGREERDRLLHQGIMPLLRGLVGDTTVPATFTQLDDWDGPVEPEPGMVNPVSGLTALEDRVFELVADLWGAWLELPVQHPDETRVVCDAVHTVQDLLCVRIARRCYPAGWPTGGPWPKPGAGGG